VLASTAILELEDYVSAKVCCLHIIVDGSYVTLLREMMLEFFAVVFNRVSTDLENLENSWNFVNLEICWNTPKILC